MTTTERIAQKIETTVAENAPEDSKIAIIAETAMMKGVSPARIESHSFLTAIRTISTASAARKSRKRIHSA